MGQFEKIQNFVIFCYKFVTNLYRILLDICNRKSRNFGFSQIAPEYNIIRMVGLEHVLGAQKMFFMTSNIEFHSITIFEKSLFSYF